MTDPNTLIDLVDLAEQRDWLAARFTLDSLVRLRGVGVESLEDFDFQASVSQINLGAAATGAKANSTGPTTDGVEVQVAGQLRAAVTVSCQR
ncbi:MAG: hypothetical protein HKM24_04930, partial [Gammaproteobacteria bacterium]|nr:hypothetical protein [Gammaproteobacteria bacterium]